MDIDQEQIEEKSNSFDFQYQTRATEKGTFQSQCSSQICWGPKFQGEVPNATSQNIMTGASPKVVFTRVFFFYTAPLEKKCYKFLTKYRSPDELFKNLRLNTVFEPQLTKLLQQLLLIPYSDQIVAYVITPKKIAIRLLQVG